jgi:signal peptidase II
VKTAYPRLGLICLAAVLLLDQASKFSVVSGMDEYESIPIFGNFFFTYVHNPGGAFSLLADASPWLRHPLFLSVTIAALWIGYSYWKSLPQADTLSEVALGLVAGGAVGNQVDRLRLGKVIDFLHVDIPTGWLQWISSSIEDPYTWPIFNIADSAVCVGIALLAWRLFRPAPLTQVSDVS